MTHNVRISALIDRILNTLYTATPVRAQIVAAITGGGIHASNLLIRGGSSSSILEIQIPYARASILQTLSEAKPSDESSFCSYETAVNLAQSSWRRAQSLIHTEFERNGMQFLPLMAFIDSYHRSVGIGCTASLSTNRVRKGRNEAFISICTAKEASKKCQAFHLTFNKELKRTRKEEDEIVSYCLIYALGDVLRLEVPAVEELHGLISSSGDVLCPIVLNSDEHAEMTQSGDCIYKTMKKTVSTSQQRTLANVCILHDAESATQSILNDFQFRGIIVSGSFNPLHNGHIKLAQAAQNLVMRHFNLAKVPACGYEIAIQNADKGSITAEILCNRIKQFSECMHSTCAILISTATLFLEKARLFPNSIFVIGADTAIRLVDVKYYGDDKCRMMITMHEIIRQHQCQFVIAGRLVEDKIPARYVSALEALQNVPREYRDAFLILSEDAFRIDISSSEIRALKEITE